MADQIRRVLVVEDDALMGMELRDLLEGLGCEVCDVISWGEEAVKAVGAQDPDLIIMDIKLKGEMSGIEAAQRVRLFTEIPIVFLTGYKNDAMVEASGSIRNTFFIPKPFDTPHFQNVVRRLLGL